MNARAHTAAKRIAVSLAFVAAFLALSRMAVDDAEKERTHYCRMVQSGAWPDYQRNALTCPAVQVEKERQP